MPLLKPRLHPFIHSALLQSGVVQVLAASPVHNQTSILSAIFLIIPSCSWALPHICPAQAVYCIQFYCYSERSWCIPERIVGLSRQCLNAPQQCGFKGLRYAEMLNRMQTATYCTGAIHNAAGGSCTPPPSFSILPRRQRLPARISQSLLPRPYQAGYIVQARVGCSAIRAFRLLASHPGQS